MFDHVIFRLSICSSSAGGKVSETCRPSWAAPRPVQVAGGFAKSMGWQWGMWAPGIIGMIVGLFVLLVCK